MKLDDPFLGKAQVHALRVLQVEGTLVELGDGIVGVQQSGLLVHLSNDLRENYKNTRSQWFVDGRKQRKMEGFGIDEKDKTEHKSEHSGSSADDDEDEGVMNSWDGWRCVYQSWQSHPRHGANQLHCLAVVDVTVSHSELFSF